MGMGMAERAQHRAQSTEHGAENAHCALLSSPLLSCPVPSCESFWPIAAKSANPAAAFVHSAQLQLEDGISHAREPRPCVCIIWILIFDFGTLLRNLHPGTSLLSYIQSGIHVTLGLGVRSSLVCFRCAKVRGRPLSELLQILLLLLLPRAPSPSSALTLTLIWTSSTSHLLTYPTSTRLH